MTTSTEHDAPPRTRAGSYAFATVRLAVSLAVAGAIIATFFDTAARGPINPFNFFGFFTMQSNIIAATVLVLAALATFSGRGQSSALQLARGFATTYIVIVGIVYNTLLAGLEGGVSLAWANWVLHVFFPLYAALDWIVFGDRYRLPWSRLWVVTVYPLVWLVVVIIRGATDGWVPYPFLDPAQGYGVVAIYCIAIFVLTVLVASAVFAISRIRILRSGSGLGPPEEA
ncbi:hypothetical protein E6C70_10120 [Glaciibacter flavus]|uniref:F420-dependent oxidoreductase n=1 Tax=Orlajensenia flava TaxID=2565934 RepID=A0A4S4FVU9_9MICO|nr:Pr6Pr family membrane protein [Glaciibacter flavus]THG34162.1 hypothetical protein E6C70_10120 [Glaciibacter flavus]